MLISSYHINIIKSELEKSLPGENIQYKMSPEGRIRVSAPDHAIQAAVLIIVYPVNSILYTVLIKRPSYIGHHSNQISFPGGKFEPSDIILQHTALRETFEEIGIDPKLPEILGALSPLFIPISGILVSPFVAYLTDKPNWKLNHLEVSRILEIPLEFFTKRKNVRNDKWLVNNMFINVPYYQWKGDKIWGATAMVISEFGEILRRCQY